MSDPVVALIASYKEGTLIQGAIRSALTACTMVYVADGPTEGVEIEGADETDLGVYRRCEPVKFITGEWEAESLKRTFMLQEAKRLMGIPFWILTLDADEILVWGEYLQDWLGQLRPGHPESGENIVPLRRTEQAWRDDKTASLGKGKLDVVIRSGRGFYTDIAPSRLVHSSLVDRYEVSCWIFITPDEQQGVLEHREADRMPLYGEPHVHHRAYMRRPERKVLRLSQGEEKRWMEKNFPHLSNQQSPESDPQSDSQTVEPRRSRKSSGRRKK